MKHSSFLNLQDQNVWLQRLSRHIVQVIHNRGNPGGSEKCTNKLLSELEAAAPIQGSNNHNVYKKETASSIDMRIRENDTTQEAHGDEETDSGDRESEENKKLSNNNEENVLIQLSCLSTSSDLKKTKTSLVDSFVDFTTKQINPQPIPSISQAADAIDATADQYNCIICSCLALTKNLRKRLYTLIHNESKNIRVVYLFICPSQGYTTKRKTHSDKFPTESTSSFAKDPAKSSPEANDPIIDDQLLEWQLDLMELPNKYEKALPFGELITSKHVTKNFALTTEKSRDQIAEEMLNYLELKFFL